MTDWKVISGILILPLLALGTAYLLLSKTEESVRFSFVETGNLIRNNPGLEPNAWYLSYEEQGAPGKIVRLLFDGKSRCGLPDSARVCDMSFEQGARVRVEGISGSDAVQVLRLEEIK